LYPCCYLSHSGIAPRFLNAVTDVTITSAEAVGAVIYTLQYTDDNPTDIATLTAFMESSAHFELSGSGIRFMIQMNFGYIVLS